MDIKNLVMSAEALEVIDTGTWVDDLAGAPGLKLRVCGMKSKRVRRAMESKEVNLRIANPGRNLTQEQLSRATQEVLHEEVLKEWDGLTNDGEPIVYTTELAKKFLTGREGERFAEIVLQAARIVDAQANQFVEKVSKN